MKRIAFFIFVFQFACLPGFSTETDLIAVSQQLLLAAKRKEPTDSFRTILQNITTAELSKQLNTNSTKKAFWINIYNAYTQVLLSTNPERYKKRSTFFGSKEILIAGESLSLDNIEHGLLRRSKTKWSLGYINKLFPNKFEREQRVDSVDYRIHFTLNCGAKSCPPIAFYRPTQLEQQLNLATKSYLSAEAVFNKDSSAIYLPTFMSWFRADFGGKKGIKKLLKKLAILTENQSALIRFSKYDWNLFLDNYKTI